MNAERKFSSIRMIVEIRNLHNKENCIDIKENLFSSGNS